MSNQYTNKERVSIETNKICFHELAHIHPLGFIRSRIKTHDFLSV